MQIDGGGIFTDGNRGGYQNWWVPATADHDEILFLMKNRPFLYHRVKRPRLVVESAPGERERYFDLDSIIRPSSIGEAVRWFERHGRDVPDTMPFTAAVKSTAGSGGNDPIAVKLKPWS